jgi:hypothetical protein
MYGIVVIYSHEYENLLPLAISINSLARITFGITIARNATRLGNNVRNSARDLKIVKLEMLDK